MQSQAAGQRFAGSPVLGEFGEDFHFDGAKQRLRGPEGQAGLQNVVG